MIKVKKNDSIVDIITKIKDEKDKKIILKIPFGHPILHNYTSLKILKIKSGEKELIISTNDSSARKIGKKIGIKYSFYSDSNLIEHNYGFWEYLLYKTKSYGKEIYENVSLKNNPFYKYQNFYGEGKISYFIWFLITSILLLFLVYYFAVNKTYVYIKPEISVKYRAKNFIFKELPEESIISSENIIKLKKIENTVNLNSTFGTTGIKNEKTTNAKGKVIIYNLFEEKSSLIKNTRLQTKDGLVFLLKNEINIPASRNVNGKIIPGKKEVEVIARIKDSEGKIIGKKGNIKKGIEMFLPGLKENKNKIYAISKSNFKGGNDDYKKVLTDEDIKNAKEMLKTKIKKLGIEKLKEKLKKENEINSIKYEILGVDNIVKYSDFQVTGLDKLKIGDEIDNFKLFGTIKTKTYIYNRELLLSKIKNTIRENVLDSVEKIASINEKSLNIVLELEREEKPLKIKATAQIETFYIQNFLDKNNNYVEKLKYQIIGKDKNIAEKILINNEKIANANIKIRPFFIKKVSNLAESIKFVVIEK